MSAADRAGWPLWAREAFEERAAIMEYDGGLERADAERKAEEAIRLELAQRVVGGIKRAAGRQP